MTVRLRAHHLLCMLTYVGKGYSPRFVENYETIAQRLSAGEEIEIVEGPDDICRPLLVDAEPHCLGESVVARDLEAARTISMTLRISVATGSHIRLDADLLSRLQNGFSGNTLRSACRHCEWSALCDVVAASDFALAKIQPAGG
ncbi:DUF1284 domain-containing protein [Ciceribacter sp. L1K22]|uniref:DUF1284 domain-containing protein n=1 Tax=Ciceribacter sp. L1K22 TaxID=2820275 RepID=UPI001ABED747|nr:DUF1284 domain-containing protein [Ciceribacter sp. L1K22]MBO3759182.1 DUF1284 domain-containing protein [Ciceribacter sp. L1K22]